MNENILTIRDTADYLKMSSATIYKLILTGDLPAAKVGNKWRIRRTRLEEWMDEKENCNYGSEALVLEL
ncbi:helix-turn-helix domain-containing protein [candidate division KSB1 bacterium]